MNLRKLSIPLFWRLFLSLLLMLLVTSILSTLIERAMNAQALESRMAAQVTHVVSVRQSIIQALEVGDYDAVRQIYRNERGIRNQIIVINDQGVALFSRFRSSDAPSSREAGTVETIGPPSDHVIQDVVPDTDSYPELRDIPVTTPDGDTYTVQLQPRLPLHDLVALQKTHLPVRFGIIILFSVLACYWFSRTLSKRIRHVQFAVHRMSEGDYQAYDDLSKLGDDELGALAKDVSELSNRLADSELSRKQMLSDISHELRSPLARLDVATELTRDYAPEATHYLDRIQKESARMNDLIAQIISIQSLQMQRYKTQSEDYESVNIQMLLDEIGQDVCFEFYDKHINWHCIHNEFAYTVIGNREQLHSAFENVIRNAFIYSNPNSIVSAKIETVILENQRSALKVSITDQGSGIDDADVARIFQPFVRLDASRQRPVSTTASHALDRESNSNPHRKREGGYGLGLAIAQAIIAAHKGQINARNRQDGTQGLVVEIVLPVPLNS